MRYLRFLLVLLAPAAVAACGEAGQTGDAPADSAAEVDAAADTAGTAEALQLEPLNESGITGEAYTERAPGDSAVVVLELQGLEEGSEYPAHVHDGRCETGGGVAAALNPVTGGAEGSGASRTTVATAQFSDTLDYYVQAHLPDGTPASCANVPTAEADEGEGTTEGS